MRRILLIVLSCVFLVGCMNKPLTEQERKMQIISQGVIFDSEYTNALIGSQSEQYKSLYSKLYAKAIQTLEYDSSSDSFAFDVYDIESYKQIVQKDLSGFQKDYANMLSLDVQQNTIDNYIWSYVRNALGALPTVKSSVKLNLGTNNSFDSDKEICTILQEQIKSFYDASVLYDEEDEESWEIPKDKLSIGKGEVLPVSCDKALTNCFIRIDKILQGSEAEEYIRGLSSVNKGLQLQQIYVVTYTIMNLSDNVVIYTDKFCSVTKDGAVINYNSSDIAGLEKSKKLEPYVETTITNMYVGDDSGSLLWFDKGTNYLLEVSLD